MWSVPLNIWIKSIQWNLVASKGPFVVILCNIFFLLFIRFACRLTLLSEFDIASFKDRFYANRTKCISILKRHEWLMAKYGTVGWNIARKLSITMLKFICTHLFGKYIERMSPLWIRSNFLDCIRWKCAAYCVYSIYTMCTRDHVIP